MSRSPAFLQSDVRSAAERVHFDALDYGDDSSEGYSIFMSRVICILRQWHDESVMKQVNKTV